jgi:hypothetical protein
LQFWILDFGFWIKSTDWLIEVIRFWILDFGFWIHPTDKSAFLYHQGIIGQNPGFFKPIKIKLANY